MLSEFVSRVDLPASILCDVKLAVTEACTNAVKHAYADTAIGVIDVIVDVDDTWLRVVVRDYGVGINQSVATRGLGLGLPIIKALTATLSVDQCDPGTRTAMTFALKPRPLTAPSE